MEIAKLSPVKQNQYYQSVRETLIDEFGQMKGFMKTEIEGMIRNFYRDLATQAKDEQEMTAYRITLKFIKDFENRLLYLASKAK